MFTCAPALCRLLEAGQQYDMFVSMRLPETDPNTAAGACTRVWRWCVGTGCSLLDGGRTGMFMLDVDLFDEDREPLGHAAQPVLMTHVSWMIRTLRTALFAVPLVLGVQLEEQTHALR